jgi:hypothetical protein
MAGELAAAAMVGLKPSASDPERAEIAASLCASHLRAMFALSLSPRKLPQQYTFTNSSGFDRQIGDSKGGALVYRRIGNGWPASIGNSLDSTAL